jgi:CPA1 family monovalent cation:H+ antiporter
MNTFELISLLFLFSAAFSYLNFKIIKLPHTIGLMATSLLFSLLIFPLNFIFPEALSTVKDLVGEFEFSDLVLNVLLCYLLFAGSFHTNLNDLKKEKLSITVFALVSVLLCVALVGSSLFFLLRGGGFTPSIWSCLLFGALISPTDPIAVLGILSKSKMPERIKTNIIGESLFNDGVGVVIFLVIAQIINQGTENVTFLDAIKLFAIEAGGGMLFGLLLGYIVHFLLKSINHYQTELLITLAAVTTGYIAAQHLHISGPLAMVVAGLMTGNFSRHTAMSNLTEEYIDKFWEIVDEMLNAFLFVLMGVEILMINIGAKYWSMALAAVILCLLARYISVGIPYLMIRKKSGLPKETPLLMTWGGLRGGLSIAMALSIQKSLPEKDLWLFSTYIIVIFSIIVQALSLTPLLNRLYKKN